MVFEPSGRSFVIKDLRAFGKMGPGHNYFERNSLDFFEVVTECFKPCKIIVFINGVGNRPEWHLEYIEIKVTGNGFGTAGFPVSNWLARGTDVIVDYCPHS